MDIRKIYNDFIKKLPKPIYNSFSKYLKNNLSTYASSCSFAFFISLVPIFILIATISIRIMHTSPDFLDQIFGFANLFIEKQRILKLLESLINIKKIGIFEIIIAFFIFWMSKNFFLSITKGIKKIYKEKIKPKPFWPTIFGLLLEVIFVIGLSIFVSVIFGLKKFIQGDFAILHFPQLVKTVDKIFIIIPEIIIFITVTLVYHFAPGTKPKLRLCILSSFLCTVTFKIVRSCFMLFLNLTKYNIIYGFLANVIIILINVQMFFNIFFFFCQFLYCIQFDKS